MFDFNRRRFPRVSYPCQLTLWLMDDPDKTISANTFNIGMGGVAVSLGQKIEPGTRVDIQLDFTNPSTPFKCKGVVVHSHKESEALHGIGIQFEPLSEIKFAFLDGKVSELIELEQKGKN